MARGEDRVAAFERELSRRLEAASSLSDGRRADDTIIGFGDALAMIGVSRNTLYRLCKGHEIPGVRKVGNRWRFHRQALLNFLACKSPPGSTDMPADSGTVSDRDLASRTHADLKALQARYAETRGRLDEVCVIVSKLERKVRALKAKNATMKARHTSSVRKLEEEIRDLKAKNATMKARHDSSVSFTEATRAALRRNDMQVVVTRVVPGLGGDCVDAFPLTPGKVIRFEHPRRPAYQPTAIQLGVSMANGAVNFSDLEIQFYLVGGDRREGRRFGPKFRGDQFVDCYGAPINVQWPLHQGRPVIVGSLERLAVEVRHRGRAHHVNSIAVVVFGISGHRLAET